MSRGSLDGEELGWVTEFSVSCPKLKPTLRDQGPFLGGDLNKCATGLEGNTEIETPKYLGTSLL